MLARPLPRAWRGRPALHRPYHRRAPPPRATPPALIDPTASDPLPLPPLDAVLVLGGGLRDDGSLPPWVQRRLDVAADIRRAAAAPPRGAPPLVLLGAGTPHKPPPTDAVTGRPLTEGTAGARYLVRRRGVPAAAVLKETQSYDTVGNALFGFTTHVAPRGWRTLAIVTSTFHMARTRAIFGRTFDLAAAALAARFSLHYVAVADDGAADPAALAARAKREAESTGAWEASTAGFTTLAALHEWVFDTHLCYATARQDEFGAGSNAGVDPKVLETY